MPLLKPAGQPVNAWMALLIMLLAVELIPLVSFHTANLLDPLLSLSQWDADGVFAWLGVHHLLQLLLSVVVMLVVFPRRLSAWGFNFHHWRTSLIIIVVFAVAFTILEYAYRVGQPYVTDFPQTHRNELGWQVFQYLISGLGEEPLFRGIVIVLLLAALSASSLSPGLHYLLAVVVSTGLFMYAHLDVNWWSMSAPGYDFGQQTKALQMGVLCGAAFIYTRSLFAPIVLHGLSNGITASLGFYVV